MATNARYQYPADNELSNATLSLGTGSTAVGYSLSYLFDGSLANGWGASAATTFYLLQDYGGSATKAMKWIAFHNHNFDAGLTITIEGNASNAWGGPSFSTSVTTPALRADGRGQDFVWLNTTQSSAYRWWRIGCTSTNSAAWRIGELWCSVTASRVISDQNFLQGVQLIDVREGIAAETPTGLMLKVADPSVRTRIIGNTLGTRAQMELIRDWRRKCSGFTQPTSFILEDDATSKECFMVTHDDDSGAMQQISGSQWGVSVSLTSQSPGLGWS